jgi:hypothetical protein
VSSACWMSAINEAAERATFFKPRLSLSFITGSPLSENGSQKNIYISVKYVQSKVKVYEPSAVSN